MGLMRWFAVGAVLLLVACAGPAPASEHDILMFDNRFEPLELIIPRADVVRLHLVNQGNDVHNFEISVGGHKAVVVGPKLDNNVTLLNPAVGRYPFFCSVPGHQGMQGTLIIQ